MESVIPHLYVGSDADYERIKDKDGWAVLRACKHGPDGHSQTLGYKTHAAPKGKHYLSVQTDNKLALNMIDGEDPNYFPAEMIHTGLDFIQHQLGEGMDVLVACNKGESRGPTLVLMYLRRNGEMPYSFFRSEQIFKTLCPAYNPGIGMRQAARSMWADLGRENPE